MARGIGLALGAALVITLVVSAMEACSSYGSVTAAPDDAGDDGAPFDASQLRDGDAGDGSIPCDAHTICEDFESPSLSAQWTEVEAYPPAYLQVSTEQSRSPTHALLVGFPAVDGGGGAITAFVGRSMPAGKGIRCSLFVYVDALSDIEASIVYYATTPLPSYVASVTASRTATTVYAYAPLDGATGVQAALGPALSLRRWTEIDLVIDLARNTVEVDFEGKALVTSWSSPPMGYDTQTLDIGAGPGPQATSVPMRLFVDDVTCDVR
jgi:hypothetical protein